MILQALTRYYEDLLAQGKIDAPGWAPSKISYRMGNRRINAVQYFVVKSCSCGKALAAAFRLPFLVDAEQISGIVPQKVRGNADRSFHRCRQHHQLRPRAAASSFA